jgi:uncharacterized protein
MTELAMEIRDIDGPGRQLVGVVMPYNETTYLVAGGERVRRGAFRRSGHHKASKVPLLENHKQDVVMGWSSSWDDGETGLVGTFTINAGDIGDRFLENLRNGYMGGLSVGFQPVQADRAPDGVREIREAKLHEVSTVGIPAYDGAKILAVRKATDITALFGPRPEVNLDPVPPIGYRSL